MAKGLGASHARQFKRMRKVIKRQRTVLGHLEREVQRKLSTMSVAVRESITETLNKAQRLIIQTKSLITNNKTPKLYSWHAPEVGSGIPGVDKDNPNISIKHRGKFKSLNDEEKKLLKRRQAIEPIIGHLKADHRMHRCYLKEADGDAVHAVLCAAGYNIRWLLRMIVKKGISLLLRLLKATRLPDFALALSQMLVSNQLRYSPISNAHA